MLRRSAKNMSMRIFTFIGILAAFVLSSACRSTEPKSIAEPEPSFDSDLIAGRIAAVLDQNIPAQTLTAIERGVLRQMQSAHFNPYPFASHYIYTDQISDFAKGIVVRTHYDYSGNIRRSSEIKLEREKLMDYLKAVVFVQFNGSIPSNLPHIVEQSFTSFQMAEPDSDGNAEKPPGVERPQ
jgi:hypothetical protein